MVSSLQEELLKAGLVDKDQVEKAQRKTKKTKRQQRASKPKKAQAAQATSEAERVARREKATRDRELDQQRNEVRRQREVAAQVRQLVRQHRHPRAESENDRPFHFENKGKVKRIFVSEDTRRLVASGKLVIVNDNGVFELVPPAIAEKIRQRNPSLVIDLPAEKAPTEDDPYAAFQVPDDLMW